MAVYSLTTQPVGEATTSASPIERLSFDGYGLRNPSLTNSRADSASVVFQ